MDLESVSIPPTVWSDRTLLSGLDVSPCRRADPSCSPTGCPSSPGFGEPPDFSLRGARQVLLGRALNLQRQDSPPNALTRRFPG